MASRSFGVYCPLARPIRRVAFPTPFLALGRAEARPEAGGVTLLRGNVVCSAVQESSTATVSGTEAEPAKKEVAEKPKRVPPAKAAVKSLPQLMEEDVIPSLRSTLQAQEDISEIELAFIDNRLEGSFMKKDIPYCFWVFFPDGVLTGQVQRDFLFLHMDLGSALWNLSLLTRRK